MAIRLNPAIRQGMLDQMADAYPAEGCGIIIGTWRGEEAIGQRYHPCRNQTEETSSRRFLIDPLQYQALEDQADAQGMSIVSIVHSHPDHPDEPSEFDRRHAWPGLSYIIVAVSRGQVTGYRAWRLRDDRSCFDPESINEGGR